MIENLFDIVAAKSAVEFSFHEPANKIAGLFRYIQELGAIGGVYFFEEDVLLQLLVGLAPVRSFLEEELVCDHANCIVVN